MTELGSPEFWDLLREDPARLAATVCAIDVVNLDETLQRHAALRAWVNAAHEVARIAEEREKWNLTRARALAYMDARALLEKGKVKPVATLSAETDLDPRVQAAQEALTAAEEKRGALRAMASALEDRKDMLIQISAKRRAESRDHG